MSVDLSGLPKLPDTSVLRDKAAAITTAADDVETLCDDCYTDWQPIQGAISCSYGEDVVYAAMNRMDEYGEGVSLSGKAVDSALTAYCDEVDGLRSRYEAAVADARVCYAPDATTDDGSDPEQEAQDEINAVARQLKEMEQRCADSIKAADPSSSVVAPPNYPTSVAVAGGATKDALERLRVRDYRFTISHTVTTRTLDYSRLEVRFADGSSLTHERLVLTESATRVDVEVRGRTTGMDLSPGGGGVGEPPRWAKLGGNVLGVLDVGMTAWSAGTDEWNDDLIEHPEYSDAEQWGSAAKSAGLRTVGAGVGGAAGASVGAVAGAALFGTIGSVVPIAGTAAGIAVGGFVGGVVGGFVGGTIGEGIGGFVDNVTDGEGLGEAIGNAWNDLWG
ncbi:hypothetical protein [Arthrobacter castelli]|uniref:hypothetical protein n=1 Tax=Arthrobacter castelli TaxID=271431 RepID=UPI00041852E4|nr:hypothetical protein [Arthrobacter castelli]